MGASQSSISPAQKTPGRERSIRCSSSAAKSTPPALLMASSIGRGAMQRDGQVFDGRGQLVGIGEIGLRHELP